MLAFLPLMQTQDAQAQDSPLLKSVEPNYDQHSEDLATDFAEATASVTLTVLSDGKPFALDRSSVPLPMAVVMALKDYEFRPQGTVPHGRSALDGSRYEVTLQVPIRQSKVPVGDDAIFIGPGIAAANRIKMARPQYPESARHNRIQGRITFEAVITPQGYVGSLKTSYGQFVLIEAAYNAIKQWQYRPTIINGEAVEVRTELEVNFTLN